MVVRLRVRRLRKRIAKLLEEEEVVLLLLLLLLVLCGQVDRHCRSHNIAAECCVGSSCGSGRESGSVDLGSSSSVMGKSGKLASRGSSLMSWSRGLSAGVGGVVPLSTDSLDDMASESDGAGVSALLV